MPLSELYRVARGKLDSTQDKNNMVAADLSLNPENDVFELVWENGQILLQGQSSRTRKNSNLNTSQAQCLPSHSPRDRDRDGHFNNAKLGKFGAIDSVVRDVIPMAPSPDIALGHDDDDDMVPWLNYPLDGHLQHDYSSDFLPELSGVTVNDPPSRNSVASSIGKASSGNQANRDTHLNSLHGANLENGNISKLSSLDVSTTRPRSSMNQLHSSGSQQNQASLPHLRIKSTGATENTTGKILHDSLMGSSPHVPLIVSSSSSTARKKLDPTPPSNSSNIINFSHFLRPAALLKSNAQNHDVTGAVGLSGMRSVVSMDKNCSAANSQPHESKLIGTRGSIRNESNSCCKNAVVPSIDDNNPSDSKPPEQLQAVKQPEVACLGDSAENADCPKQCLEAGATKGLPDSEKAIESVIAASVCSRTSVEGASDDLTLIRKRKYPDTEDSEWHSDDVEEECNDVKRATPARGTGSKRSRAAEVHNLSERRRRDRINEKMRALQELIPNCNKVDKASMLDEAIEYLKTLQLQVQIMSMGAGLFMPPMMFPGGMTPMNAPHIYSPMGVGMGMGFGIGMPDMNGGSPGYPMVQVPHMQGAHFPGPSIPAQTAMHGMPGSNFQVLGLPGQGFPMPMPRVPIAPFPGGPFMTNSGVAVAPVENFGLAAACSSKDGSPNINSSMVQNGGNDPSITPAPIQANEQASCVNGSGVNPTSKNDLITN